MERRIPTLVAALALVSAGCVGGTAATTTEPSPTTTTLGSTTTQAEVTITPGGLVPAEPGTLVPLAVSPLVTGDFHDGVVSANGHWALVRTWASGDNERNSVVLIDLRLHEVVNTVAADVDDIAVSNAGVGAYLSTGAIGLITADDVASLDLPDLAGAHPMTGTLAALDGGLFAFAAVREGGGPITVVTLGPDNARVVEVEPVYAGSTQESETEEGLWVFENMFPAITWDAAGDTALVVSAEEDIVAMVDMTDGTISTHAWDLEVGWFDRLSFGMARARAKGLESGVTREAFWSQGSATLYVATRVSSVTGPDDAWEAVTESKPLLAIDTTTWAARELDPTAWAIQASLDGSRLLAMGGRLISNAAGESGHDLSPVTVVETSSGDLLGEYRPTSGTIVDAGFSPTADIFYIRSFADGAVVDIVDLRMGQIVGSVGFREMSLIEEAALLAFHLDS